MVLTLLALAHLPFSFETLCFVYHLNLYLSNCKYYSKLNKVTMHNLVNSKPSTCVLYYNNILK